MKFWKTFLACLLAVVSSGMLLIMIGGMVVASVGVMLSPQSATMVVPNSVLRLDLGHVSDKPSTMLFDNLDPNTLEVIPAQSTLEIVETIGSALADNNIKGIYLHLGEHSVLSAAAMEEIRAALLEFRASGKWIVAYEDYYSQMNYWFASVANRVFLNPMGNVEWHGLSSQVMFYKGLLDKLDIEPQIVRHGTFKAAVEPFMTTRMSEANRTQTQTLVNSLWRVVVEDVAVSRGLTPHYIELMADKLSVDCAAAALEYGFVDGLMYESEVETFMAEVVADSTKLTPARTEVSAEMEVAMTVPDSEGEKESTPAEVKATKQQKINIIPFADYLMQRPVTQNHISKNKVAVIYAEGDIVSGSGPKAVGDVTMRKLIKQAADDKGVKAVVLRVNSPGGSALAAEQIWYELQQLRNKKPLIISMGSYAASGGYYIAAPGDAIIADRMTITGSIGVFGMFVDMGDALRNKLGITVDGVSTSSHSDIGTPFRAMDATERAYFQRSVDDVYTTFVGRVASGRNLTFEQVDAIAEGRVWSATDAHRIGLVDDLGGLAAAINVAADRAGVINDFRIVEITEELTGIQQLFSNMSVSIREQMLRKQLGILYDTWNNIRSLQTHTGLRAELPYTIHIN